MDRLLKWDLDDDKVAKWEEIGGGGIWAMEKSLDGRLALACDDGAVRICDGESFELFGILKSESSRCLCLSWGPTGTDLAVGHDDGFVRLWRLHPPRNLDAGEEILRITVQDKSQERRSVRSVLCLEGEIVAGDDQGAVSFWDSKFGSLLTSFDKQEADVTVLVHSIQDRVEYILAGGVDTSVTVFQKKSGKWEYLHVRRPHRHDVNSIILFQHDGLISLLTGSQDGLVHYVEGKSESDIVKVFLRKKLKTLDATPEAPLLILCRSARILVSAGRREVEFWRLPDDPSEARLEGIVDGEVVAEGMDVELKCRLSLSSELHIVCAAASDDLKWMAVSTREKLKLVSIDAKEPFACRSIQSNVPPLCQVAISGLMLIGIDHSNKLIRMDLDRRETKQIIELKVPRLDYGLHPTGLTVSSDQTRMIYYCLDRIYLYSITADGTLIGYVFAASDRGLGIQFDREMSTSAPIVALALDRDSDIVSIDVDRSIHRILNKPDDDGSISHTAIPALRSIDATGCHSLSIGRDRTIIAGFPYSFAHLSFDYPLTQTDSPIRHKPNPKIVPTSQGRRLLYSTHLTDSSILLVEADWSEVMRKRPSPVYRHRYGT